MLCFLMHIHALWLCGCFQVLGKSTWHAHYEQAVKQWKSARFVFWCATKFGTLNITVSPLWGCFKIMKHIFFEGGKNRESLKCKHKVSSPPPSLLARSLLKWLRIVLNINLLFFFTDKSLSFYYLGPWQQISMSAEQMICCKDKLDPIEPNAAFPT